MPAFLDPITMQHQLFAELSRMFGEEVPMYDRSLLVNRISNRTAADLLALRYRGFSATDEQIDRTSGERHGAIRIGKPIEYQWIARYFGQFGMLAHNFYDMTSVGTKSQPIIASAFRSSVNPEHRVFTSLLQTASFPAEMRERIESLLATRQVFTGRAMELIERAEADGGLTEADAQDLVSEGARRIFKWTGRARDHQLYVDLCGAGLKIAADIACFETHHLNHLTPNTLCMDLFTASMKFAMGEWDESQLRRRAAVALDRLATSADRATLALLFRHLRAEEIDGFADALADAAHARTLDAAAIDALIDAHVGPLVELRPSMSALPHNGFKDATEGPSWNTPILLRQDAYRALTEPVTFVESDGREIQSEHTARFGEIEQRGWATTPAGRTLYDACLADAEAERAEHPERARVDPDAHEAAYVACFDRFPSTLPALLAAGLVFGSHAPTEAGRSAAAAGSIDTTDLAALVQRGLVRVNGLRYESFLPVSAAGIFASNLDQYGTQSYVRDTPEALREHLETLVGGTIIDPVDLSAALEARSILDTYRELGLLDAVDDGERTRLTSTAGLLDEITARQSPARV
ncbi:MAG: DUF1338 family protein [Phycisphaerales bacterium]